MALSAAHERRARLMLKMGQRRGNRRRRRASADFVLEVSATSRSGRRHRQRLIMLWALRLVLLALIGLGAFHLGAAIFDRFFFSNPEYTLRKLEFSLGDVMTRDEALELTGLREGVNIFSVDLARLEKILSADDMVARARIERQLPDRLIVAIEPRKPLAWVEIPNDDAAGPPVERLPSNGFLVEASGLLMKPRRLTPEHLGLPAIHGVPAALLVAGTRPEHEGLAGALDLLAECSRHPDALLRPRRLDVSRG
ncbi:MAG: FtsQ-type POTRA domain-containing protein, partial [Terrimicrobiaceae bacterium]|nr:FtsQ-type POTRA domain-containing protein [Terrimicrobiaceae bacterium]